MKPPPLDVVPEIAAPLTGNYGAADAGIPVDDVTKREEALKQNNKRYDNKIYPDAKLAFHREGPNYHDFLCTLFDAWYNDGGPVASVRLFENILALYMGGRPRSADAKTGVAVMWWSTMCTRAIFLRRAVAGNSVSRCTRQRFSALAERFALMPVEWART